MSLVPHDHEGQVHYLASAGDQTIKLEGRESKEGRGVVSELRLERNQRQSPKHDRKGMAESYSTENNILESHSFSISS